jgi:gluconolactonase
VIRKEANRVAPSLDSLIDPKAELACLGTDYEFTEGPVWVPAESCLYFSDIPGDTRWKWSEGGGMEVAERPTFKGNGMALDNDGHLLVCEQVSSCLVRFRAGQGRELVAFHYRGVYLNSPNDVVTRGVDGSIYFTDPDYGRWNDWIGQERSRTLGFRGLYRVPPNGGELELVVDEGEFDQPNGLCFSPDETLLYVNDSAARNVKVFDVAPDGSLGASRLVHENIGSGVPREGNVDGMECDEHGNVWVTGPGGVWVLTPEGAHLGVVETPEVCGSMAWGGDDLRSLFLMTTTSVHVVPTLVGPAPLPPF